jgi:hypothetical protein
MIPKSLALKPLAQSCNTIKRIPKARFGTFGCGPSNRRTEQADRPCGLDLCWGAGLKLGRFVVGAWVTFRTTSDGHALAR